nr:hypothetical protein Iba_chr08fCG1170 [Ipomoea batatas]
MFDDNKSNSGRPLCAIVTLATNIDGKHGEFRRRQGASPTSFPSLSSTAAWEWPPPARTRQASSPDRQRRCVVAAGGRVLKTSSRQRFRPPPSSLRRSLLFRRWRNEAESSLLHPVPANDSNGNARSSLISPPRCSSSSVGWHREAAGDHGGASLFFFPSTQQLPRNHAGGSNNPFLPLKQGRSSSTKKPCALDFLEDCWSELRMEALWNLEDKWKVSTKAAAAIALSPAGSDEDGEPEAATFSAILVQISDFLLRFWFRSQARLLGFSSPVSMNGMATAATTWRLNGEEEHRRVKIPKCHPF